MIFIKSAMTKKYKKSKFKFIANFTAQYIHHLNYILNNSNNLILINMNAHMYIYIYNFLFIYASSMLIENLYWDIMKLTDSIRCATFIK